MAKHDLGIPSIKFLIPRILSMKGIKIDRKEITQSVKDRVQKAAAELITRTFVNTNWLGQINNPSLVFKKFLG
jgi:hypothetical protein